MSRLLYSSIDYYAASLRCLSAPARSADPRPARDAPPIDMPALMLLPFLSAPAARY